MSAGTIFDIKKFAIHDGPGIRTTVFFKGCSLDCRWCHNPESRNRNIETLCIRRREANHPEGRREEVFGRIAGVEEIITEIEKDRIFYEQSGGGATFSGGEPMLQIDFLADLLKACRAADIRTAVDTSGFVPFTSFEKIIDSTDLFLYDLKLIDDELHREYVGVSNKLILENLNKLSASRGDVIARIPLIPGITDTEKNIADTLSFLLSLKSIQMVGLLPYNTLAEDKMDRFGLDNTIGPLATQSEEKLDSIAKLFAARGYQVSVGG